MNNKIDIIIPHFKEDDWVIDTALSSINCQTGIDFNDILVTLVSDGKDHFKQSIYEKNYNFKLNYIIRDGEKNCPGLTRQYGVDNTFADFIMFMDADDSFASCFSLKYFLDYLKKDSDIDILYTGFLSEQKIGENEFKYIRMNECISTGLLHGKLFNRKFLKENDLRFEDSDCCEDIELTFRIFALAKKAIFDDTTFTYIYKHNEKSLLRTRALADFDPNINAFTSSYKAWTNLFETVIHNPNSIFNELFIKMFLDAQKMRLHSIINCGKQFNELELKELDKCKDLLEDFYNKYEKYYNKYL